MYHPLLWQENKYTQDNTHKQNEIIWNNKNILIDKHMIYLKQWQRTGIMYVNDLLDKNFNFLSHDKFQRIFQLHVPFTAYYGLISTIPPSWRCTIKRTEIAIENDVSQEPRLSKNFTTCAVYAAIIDHYFRPPTAEPKLLQYGFSKECLKKIYNLPFVTTLERKLQIFQYKIIHNILPTRWSLFRMKLCNSEICQLCKMQPQTLPHLFYLFCNFQFLVCISKLVV